MKQFRLLLMTAFAAILLFTVSCNDEGETATDEASGDTTAAATPATTTPEPAINTTPTTFMIVRHKVKDYASWKPSYDSHDSLRVANGIHSFVIGRGVEDPNMVLVAVKADDVEKAKSFSKSADLKKAMEKSGVVGAPNVSLINSVALRTNSTSDLRVISTFTVKDWDAWKTRFEAGKQYRLDNGLEDRAYGHDVDDNHKVTYVASILDSAKAVAYYKSPELKQRLDSSGVTGTPNRFWYRVAQAY